MMQEIVLRVFVVALGLLNCPKDDRGVEKWDETITAGMQEHEERLLRGEEKLDRIMAPVSEEMTNTEKEGPQDDIKNIPEEPNQSDQHVTEKDKTSNLDVTVTNQDSDEDGSDQGQFIAAISDQSLPRKHNREPETAPTASQIFQKEQDKDDGSFRDPDTPQGQKPEEKEVVRDEEVPLSHVHTKTSENETSEKAVTEWESDDYLWYLWNAFSIIYMIHFLSKYLSRNSQMKLGAEVLLPDVDTLRCFYSTCVQVSSEKRRREAEFVEGFANDLLEAMRSICDKNGGMVIEDFQIVNTCDIIVPFTPPKPQSFQCQLWNKQLGDLPSDRHFCGRIKLVENKKIQNGCPCQSSDADDDMVCLLHSDNEKVRTEKADVCDGLFCSKGTPFLSKSQVSRWFQSTIKQAWARISHKYEFELNIGYIDAPGALVIRFRSGKKISFSMNPVVTFNTDAHFFITSWSSNELDTFWTLSLTSYEDHLLQRLCGRLPKNSCHTQTLEIACFLNKRQAAVSGSCAPRDFHFKTALMHLLLAKHPSQWKPNYVVCRLRDLLAFIESSIEKKQLNHVLIGNPEVSDLPAEFTKAKPVNLFHPLVAHDCIYRNVVMHFQEMLRNANMLIHDYVAESTLRANCFI